MEQTVTVRCAEAAELDQLARLWHDAWRDAHEKLAPPEVTRARTLTSFRDRLAAMLPDVSVVGPAGTALGLCIIKDEELYQLFVAREARGSGVAAALLDDGEARLARRGVRTAWLACAIGNNRAARFYEKRGWVRARTMVNRIDTADGVFEVELWRYEKALAP
jgi:ribosomal protein S18 acetylase RimI-like enzyme